MIKFRVTIILALTVTTPAFAYDVSPSQACSAVLKLAKLGKIESSGSGKFFCKSTELWTDAGYFIVDLHKTYPEAPPGWVGSTKVGWYAVDPKNGAVYEWDMGELHTGILLSPHRAQ